jgi:phosphoglycolate phosphatase-like HAD superfamily hydrolase
MNLAIDLDGTLVTCSGRQSELMRACLRSVGRALQVQRYWHRKREGDDNLLALAEQAIDPAAAQEAARLWSAAIEDPAWLCLDRPLVPLACLHVALERARMRYARVLLVTARRSAAMARMQLRGLGLAELFDQVEICDPRRAQLHKQEVLVRNDVGVMIGDTEVDARAAMAAGSAIRLVATGQRSAAYLLRTTGLSASSGVLQVLESL